MASGDCYVLRLALTLSRWAAQRETLAHLQSAVIVLLKLLLATVTANQNLPNPGQAGEATSSGAHSWAPGPTRAALADPPPRRHCAEPPADLSLEDCDILRHREITSKAVSAILILTLKWFKTSRAFPVVSRRLPSVVLRGGSLCSLACADVMKFHYFSQLLVDSNCLLLILKMFGMQEVSTLVCVKHDRPEHRCAPPLSRTSPR